MNFKQKNKNTDSKTKKFLSILCTSIILLIPIGFMSGLILDRSEFRNEAVNNVARSWADFQVIGLPSMSFTTQKDKVDVINELELNSYETNVKINTELRKKGIFKSN